MPQGPNFEEVSDTAENDKRAKQNEEIGKWHVWTFEDEVHQNSWNGKIRQGNEQVTDHMQPDQGGLPQVAVTVRHILFR